MLAATFTDRTLDREREELKQEADKRRRSLTVLKCRKLAVFPGEN
jgi:hypothetical protein